MHLDAAPALPPSINIYITKQKRNNYSSFFFYTLLINAMTAGQLEQEINVMQLWPGILKLLLCHKSKILVLKCHLRLEQKEMSKHLQQVKVSGNAAK